MTPMTRFNGLVLIVALAGLVAGCSTVVKAGSPQAAVTPQSAPAGEESEAAPEPSAAPPSESNPATEPADEPEVYKNRIKWTTASEVDNFGYDVYRSESEDGPFEVLNSEVIEGAGTVDEPTSYEYVDDTIDPHKAYHYYVESISMDGVRERFTPIIRAAPKVSPDEEKPGEAPEGR